MRVNDELSDFVENTQPDQLVLQKSEVSIFSLFDKGRSTYEGEILRTLFNDDGFLVLLKGVDQELYKKIRQNLSRRAVFGSAVEEEMKVVAQQLILNIQDEITLVLSLSSPLEYLLPDGRGGGRLISVPKKITARTLEEVILLHERNGCLVSSDFKKVTRAGLIRINFARWTLVYLFLTKKDQKMAHDRFLSWLHRYSLSK